LKIQEKKHYLPKLQAASKHDIFSAVRQISQKLKKDCVVTTKSTVPVGTNRKIQHLLNKSRGSSSVRVVSNPEFLREGHAVDDFIDPDRLIIGAECEHSKQVVKNLYRSWISRNITIQMTSLEGAELIKYASNAFLATKISFINEISMLCEKVGADIRDVSVGMGLDNRIGQHFLKAGPGYGGSCFPKDTVALKNTFEKFNLKTQVIEGTMKANENAKQNVFTTISSFFEDKLENKTICILGLTFKPETDDLREAVSLTLIPQLIRSGVKVRAVDPQAQLTQVTELEGVHKFDDVYDAATNSDCVVLLTDWPAFCSIDFVKLGSKMKTKYFLDFRGRYTLADVYRAGFEKVFCIGQGTTFEKEPI